jgi:peptidylprolyl isomerase
MTILKGCECFDPPRCWRIPRAHRGRARAARLAAARPGNTLVIETSKGRLVVELRPEFAPKGVERIKLLAREGVYDGLLFHRVIEGFVAQTGNPNNKDGGVSAHPDLPPEFSFRLAPAAATVVVAAQRRPGGVRRRHALPGGLAGRTGAGHGRAPARLGRLLPGRDGHGPPGRPRQRQQRDLLHARPARRLDHEYTVVGRVVMGLEVVRAVAVGEPPARPDRMAPGAPGRRASGAERPHVEVLDERGPAFRAKVAALKRAKGRRLLGLRRGHPARIP